MSVFVQSFLCVFVSFTNITTPRNSIKVEPKFQYIPSTAQSSYKLNAGTWKKHKSLNLEVRKIFELPTNSNKEKKFLRKSFKWLSPRTFIYRECLRCLVSHLKCELQNLLAKSEFYCFLILQIGNGSYKVALQLSLSNV